MNAKHTPAPWTLEEHEHEPAVLIGNGTIEIARIYMTDFPAGKADSLLIAAAPDMLAALSECLTDDGAFCMVREHNQAENLKARIRAINATIREVIAKAEGKV